MAREDWRDNEDEGERRRRLREREREDFGQADYSSDYAYDPRTRTAHRAEEDRGERKDYGQADYSTDWAYDPERGRPYRRYSEDDRSAAAEAQREGGYSRSWLDRAGDFLAGRPRNYDEPGYEGERRVAPERDRDVGEDRRAATERRYDEERRRRRGPSDRVLWAVIMERLEDERGLDLRDVDVSVHNGEVTLNGTVKRKADKRRIEDLVDIDGVRYVQNNLRPRDIDRHWTLL